VSGTSWLRRLYSKWHTGCEGRRAKRPRAGCRLKLHRLEGRTNPNSDYRTASLDNTLYQTTGATNQDRQSAPR
jgi:hypothetical protein